jgi:hypothetical protein
VSRNGWAEAALRDPVIAVLVTGDDMYAEIPAEALGRVADRIRVAVLGEKTAVRDGVTPEIATREAISATREWKSMHIFATPDALLARVERHATDFVLRDCRAGKRRRAIVEANTNGRVTSVAGIEDPEELRRRRLALRRED